MVTNIKDPNEYNSTLLKDIKRHRIFENRVVKYTLIGTSIIGTALLIGYFSYLLRTFADPLTIDSSSSYSSVHSEYEQAAVHIEDARTHTSSLVIKKGGLTGLVYKELREEEPHISHE